MPVGNDDDDDDDFMMMTMMEMVTVIVLSRNLIDVWFRIEHKPPPITRQFTGSFDTWPGFKGELKANYRSK